MTQKKNAHTKQQENVTQEDVTQEDVTQEDVKQKTEAKQEADMPKADITPEAQTQEKEACCCADESIIEQIKTLEAEKEEYVNALIRERADFENYKKRNADISAVSYQNGVSDAAMAMLPVLDNFERALTTQCEDQAFVDGVDMIMRQLQEALKNLGVSEIDADGKFDPELHNAVLQVEEPGCESNSIVEVLQKGYSIKGRVLRHTMVKVAK